MSYYRQLIQTDPYLKDQIAYYPFDTDAVNVLDGQIGTSTSITYGTPAKIGSGSAGFNGSPSLITVTDSEIYTFGTGAFSINVWVYINTGALTAMILNKRTGGVIEYDLQYTTAGFIFRMFANGTTASFIGKTYTTVLPIGSWQMITITNPGSLLAIDIKAYLNGNLLTGTNLGVSYAGMINTTANVVLGRQGNASGNFFNGRLDQMRIWKGRELSASEVTDIFNTLY
jgi:hypothetical protein